MKKSKSEWILKTPEWILKTPKCILKTTGTLEQKTYFIWHTICSPPETFEEYKYSFVLNIRDKCAKCNKAPPKTLIFQKSLINGF